MPTYPSEQAKERRCVHSFKRREDQKRVARHFAENQMQRTANEPEGDQEGMRWVDPKEKFRHPSFVVGLGRIGRDLLRNAALADERREQADRYWKSILIFAVICLLFGTFSNRRRPTRVCSPTIWDRKVHHSEDLRERHDRLQKQKVQAAERTRKRLLWIGWKDAEDDENSWRRVPAKAGWVEELCEL